MIFVVTGTPRSGTQYASRLLTALGLPCKHEAVLRPRTPVVDVIRWLSADVGEASWMAWIVVPLLIGRRIPVLHTIRNPWAVIDSLVNRNQILRLMSNEQSNLQSVRDIIDAFLPDVFAYSERVDRAAAFVLGWEQLIETHAPDRFDYYVERLDVATILEMLGYLGTTADDYTISDALSQTSQKTNEGYTVDGIAHVSDPDVAKWIMEYAKEQDCGRIANCKIRNVPARETPEELAERMTPRLRDEVSAYAERHGYVDVPVSC